MASSNRMKRHKHENDTYTLTIGMSNKQTLDNTRSMKAEDNPLRPTQYFTWMQHSNLGTVIVQTGGTHEPSLSVKSQQNTEWREKTCADSQWGAASLFLVCVVLAFEVGVRVLKAA